jgi:uncharacterized protein (UPF0332 family)
LPGALSRAYYAGFHAARALLMTRSLQPRSHRGVRSLLEQHFVETGIVPADFGAKLGRLEGFRTAGDYGSGIQLSSAELSREVEHAATLLDCALQCLLREGIDPGS